MCILKQNITCAYFKFLYKMHYIQPSAACFYFCKILFFEILAILIHVTPLHVSIFMTLLYSL